MDRKRCTSADGEFDGEHSTLPCMFHSVESTPVRPPQEVWVTTTCVTADVTQGLVTYLK